MIKFIDAHAHVYKVSYPKLDGRPFPSPDEMLAYYDHIGVEKAVLLPVLGPEYFLPQSNEDVLEMAHDFPGRFIPFCNMHPRAINNSAEAPLSKLMLIYKEMGCKGIGEVTCNMPIRHPFVQNFLKHVEISGLPMTIHIAHKIDDCYGLYDDPGLPQLEEALIKFPELKILGHSQPFWAEIGVLETIGDRAGYPNSRIKDEGVIPKFMRRYPNLYGDLSAGSGFNALARDPDYAVKFLNEFQDRLIFGIDRRPEPDGSEPKQMIFLKELFSSGRISETVFRKVARENIIRILEL